MASAASSFAASSEDSHNLNNQLPTLSSDNFQTIYGNLPLSEIIVETRFLTLKPAKWDDIIECKLESHALSDAPEYFAYSYAWTESTDTLCPAPNEWIRINGLLFEVGANLAAALRSFRSSHPGAMFFADAICHNQKNKAEMRIQVGRMTDIYRRCKVVHIWLGREGHVTHSAANKPSDGYETLAWTSGSFDGTYLPSEADDQIVQSYNVEFHEFMDRAVAVHRGSTLDFHKGAFCLLHVLARGDHLRLYKTPDLEFLLDLETRDGVCQALEDIINRYWWTRQWAIQEAVLPAAVSVGYGRFTLPWAMLSCAVKMIIQHQRHCCAIEFDKFRVADLMTIDHFTDTVGELERWRTIWQDESSGMRIRLLPLLWLFRHRESGRKAGKLYALLPLVRDWHTAQRIEIHDEWQDHEIFVHLVDVLLDAHDSLLPLMGTTTKSPELKDLLPSWAPDWSVKPAKDEIARLERTLLYHASGKEKTQYGDDVLDEDHNCRLKFRTRHKVKLIPVGEPCRLKYLVLRGLLHGKIVRMGRTMRPSGTPENNEKAWERFIFERSKIISEWFEVILKDDNDNYIGAQTYASGQGTLIEAYVRTLCMDTECIGLQNGDENLPLDRKDYQRTGPGYAALLVDMFTNLQRCDDHQRKKNASDDIKCLNKHGTWKDLTEPNATSRIRPAQPGMTLKLDAVGMAIRTATTDRVIFVTDNGYIGLGPSELQMEDEVAILAGGHTPFVVRKTGRKTINKKYKERECYELVGDCYVHGLMDGEAVEHINDSDDLDQLFLE